MHKLVPMEKLLLLKSELPLDYWTPLGNLCKNGPPVLCHVEEELQLCKEFVLWELLPMLNLVKEKLFSLKLVILSLAVPLLMQSKMKYLRRKHP